MDAVEFGGQGAPDVCVLGVEGLLEGVLGLPQRLRLSLVGLDVGGQTVEFFLGGGGGTSVEESLFLSDMKL